MPSKSSTWLRTEIHSPAAIDSAPAIRLAKPARRTAERDASAPATARIRQTLLTSPSFTPRTAARAAPRTTWVMRASSSMASV